MSRTSHLLRMILQLFRSQPSAILLAPRYSLEEPTVDGIEKILASQEMYENTWNLL